jgi:hypothetical protein
MPTFNAGAIAESLDWDFHDAGVKAKGTIPEPSDRAIGDFLDGLKALYEKARADGLAGEVADGSPDAILDALTSLTGDKFVMFMADVAGLFGELCGGKPDQVTLLKLPLRVRVAFYGWVQSEVVSPEAGPGAGTAVVRTLPSAAAG